MEKNTCRYCRFAHPLADHHTPLLICDRSPSGRKSYRATHPLNTCTRFKTAPTPRPLPNPNPNERLVPVKGAPFARVDAQDYEKVAKHEWCARHTPRTCYALLKGCTQSMHRLIMNAPKHLVVDHIDHDGLNNTRKNLRLCTRDQNKHNRRPQLNCSSRYKGVWWCKPRRSWQVHIRSGKNRYVGGFKDEIQAAKAYDKRAVELFGEFAYLNFPEDHRRKT